MSVYFRKAADQVTLSVSNSARHEYMILKFIHHWPHVLCVYWWLLNFRAIHVCCSYFKIRSKYPVSLSEKVVFSVFFFKKHIFRKDLYRPFDHFLCVKNDIPSQLCSTAGAQTFKDPALKSAFPSLHMASVASCVMVSYFFLWKHSYPHYCKFSLV